MHQRIGPATALSAHLAPLFCVSQSASAHRIPDMRAPPTSHHGSPAASDFYSALGPPVIPSHCRDNRRREIRGELFPLLPSIPLLAGPPSAGHITVMRHLFSSNANPPNPLNYGELRASPPAGGRRRRLTLSPPLGANWVARDNHLGVAEPCNTSARKDQVRGGRNRSPELGAAAISYRVTDITTVATIFGMDTIDHSVISSTSINR
jgi:hypothetical protein